MAQMTRNQALEILNLPQDAGRAEIRGAYSKLCKIYHVETHPEEFQQIHQAYKIALATPAGEGCVTPFFTMMEETQTDQLFFGGEDAITRENFTGESSTVAEEEIIEREFKEPMETSPYDDLLDSLLGNTLNPGDYQELTQLIYYKYYNDLVLNADSSEDPLPDFLPTEPAEERLFFDVPWRDWKQIHWSTLFCCPEFIRKQYDYTFRDELCQLLHLTSPIDVLFELAEKQGWKRLYYRLCQWAVNYSDNDCHPITNMAYSQEKFLDIVEKELIQYKQFANFQNHLILQWLSGLKGDLFSKALRERIQFHKDFEETREKCAEDFRRMILDYPKTHSPFLKGYETLDSRMAFFAEQYLQRKDWQKIIVCSTFFDMLTDWMRGDSDMVPCALMPYDVWKMLRVWFQDSSTLGNHAVYWLAHKYYFPEYMKRQQAEIAWQIGNEAVRHYKNVFPLPEFTQGKLDLLKVIDGAVEVKDLSETEAHTMQNLFQRVKLGAASAQPFLTRITDGMIHFKFLLFASKQATNSNYGDAFCFLKDEVILYKEQENRKCVLTHQAFYDVIAGKVDYMAYQYSMHADNPAYTEEFLQSVCKNLYYYNCYAHPIAL